MIKNEPPELAAHGWQYFDSCQCSGGYKVMYRHPVLTELELEWHPKGRWFRITYKGSSTKVPPTKIEKLEKILNVLKQ